MSIELTHTPERRRVAIYARVSSSKQSEEGTINSQISLLVDHANKQDFLIPDGWIFKDDGVSGSTIQRPALDALRDLIAGGSPDIVLIYHPDRLARKYVYQVLLLDEFAKSGVEVSFYKNKKAETPEEHLLEQFQGVFAEYERAQITERCRRGRLHKAKQGSVTVLPNAPYGYKYIRDKESGLARYEIDKEESEIVVRLFKMYGEEGKGINDLSLYMNQSGRKPRKSLSGWDRETIRRILRNRAYTGLAGFGKTEKHVGDLQRIMRTPKSGRIQISKSARKDCPEDLWINIPVPIIVPDGLYRIVQEKLNNAQQFASRNTKKPSILQGILTCGKCGLSYYKKARSNAYTYYNCNANLSKTLESCGNRSIRQNELDDYVWNWIISILRNPELIATEIKRRSAEDPDRHLMGERKMNMCRERNKLLTSRNKLLDAYAEGECLSLEELKKRMHVINQRLQQVDRELAVIEAQTADKERARQSQLTLMKFAESLDSSSSQLTVEEKQRVVRGLINDIVVYEDSIKIKHCIPMGNDPNQSQQKCPLREQRSAAAFAAMVFIFTAQKQHPNP
ncbi:MAG: recombinase family protein [Parachlamydiaceae bacterium]|nr:recombinase family protein [Parachlamydiaceae bacterium]